MLVMDSCGMNSQARQMVNTGNQKKQEKQCTAQLQVRSPRGVCFGSHDPFSFCSSTMEESQKPSFFLFIHHGRKPKTKKLQIVCIWLLRSFASGCWVSWYGHSFKTAQQTPFKYLSREQNIKSSISIRI